MRNIAIVFLVTVFVNGALSYANNMGHDDPQTPLPPINIDGAWGEEADPGWISWAGGFEGDMRLTEEQLRQLNDSSLERNAQIDLVYRWPNDEIPYSIDGSFSAFDITRIKQAFASYAAKTCIRFREKTSDDQYAISIVQEGGCWSYVGRISKSYQPQKVSLANGCVYPYIIEHELMHAAGFFHEQSRYDRDQYVKVHLENVAKSNRHNFNKYSDAQITTLGEPYEYSSVMHYGARDFSTDGKIVIERLQGTGPLGNSVGLTQTDVKKLNKYYECSTTTTDATTTTTDATTTTTDATTTTAPTGCVDRLSVCDDFETWYGFCEEYPDFMNVYCPKTCGQCDSSNCTDKKKNCPKMAKKNFCTNDKRLKFMKKNCKKSCNFC